MRVTNWAARTVGKTKVRISIAFLVVDGRGWFIMSVGGKGEHLPSNQPATAYSRLEQFVAF